MSSQFKRLTRALAKSLKLDEESLVASFCFASQEDIPTVSALRRRVFGEIIKQDDESYLEWRYFGRSDFPSTLRLFKYNNQIIAALGTEPVELSNQGNVEPALRNMDAIVEPKFDNRGLGAWMTLAIQEQNNCVLATGGNENSTSMLNKLFTALPACKNFKIILHSRDFLDQKFPLPFFNGMISPMLDVAVAFYLKMKWSSKALSEELSLTYFNDVDQLLKHIVDPVDCLADIQVVRTKSYLKWRYSDNPCKHYFAAGIFNEDKLLAYVIYNLEHGRGLSSISTGQILDWSVNLKSASVEILTSLFIAAIKDLKRRGTDEVIMILNDELSNKAATAAGFIFRNVESSLFVYHAQSSENSRIFSADAWYQSLGDSDMV